MDKQKQQVLSFLRIIFTIAIIGGIWWYARDGSTRAPALAEHATSTENPAIALIQKTKNKERINAGVSGADEIIPAQGVVLPVEFSDLGPRMVEIGVIDKEKFLGIYEGTPNLRAEAEAFLNGANKGRVKITRENAPIVLNFLWAFGLGNKNPILENGPMTDPQYGGAGRFASTGGWTVARGDAMNYYSKHELVVLTAEQQALVERVSKNIYRPCCGNSTYFPDCNHGMAMLGLLELLVAQGSSEAEMYRTALSVNAYWFPDTYLTIAKYLDSKGRVWKEVDPKELLGADYSSGSGYQKIASQVEPIQGSGGSCGV